MEQNQVLLTGTVGSINELDVTPGGVVRRMFYLEHRSRQIEVGAPREVQANVRVICAGKALCQQISSLQQGDRLEVTGFLSRAGYQETFREQLVVNAQQIKLLS